MFIAHRVRDAIKDRVQSQDSCTAEDNTSQRQGFKKLQETSAMKREKLLSESLHSNPGSSGSLGSPRSPGSPGSSGSPGSPGSLNSQTEEEVNDDLVYRGPFASGRAGVSDFTFKAWLEKIGTNQRTLINTSVFEKARAWIEWLPDAVSNYYNSHFR